MKIAKVVTTCFVPRTVRQETGLAGYPLGYFQHSQNFPTRQSIIALLNLVLERELKCDPGLPVDLIIVNNDSGWLEGKQYLQSIVGRELRNGRVIVINNENYGRSFGGYNKAFQLYQDDYDYFLFTEDDILVSRDGYASIGVKTFMKTKNCGFVAYQGLTSSAFDLPTRDAISAHGGVGLTSASVLKDVVKNYGALPHGDATESQEYINIILRGEIAFTNKIYKLGYKLVAVSARTKLYDYAYDVMRGVDVKRYAPLRVALIVLIKQKMYRVAFIRFLYYQFRKIKGVAAKRISN